VFTFLSFCLCGFLVWGASRRNDEDAQDLPTLARHSRQDLRLIAFLLSGIIVMLGIVADRIG